MRLYYSNDYVANTHSIDAVKKPSWIAESLRENPISGVILEKPHPAQRLRIPTKSDTDSENNRTGIPMQFGQFSERSDARVLDIKKCPK